jgi:beta-mannosidase
VKANKPTKGLVFEEREGILVNDSALDVVPGDEQTVTVKGLDAGHESLKWTYLGAP